VVVVREWIQGGRGARGREERRILECFGWLVGLVGW